MIVVVLHFSLKLRQREAVLTWQITTYALYSEDIHSQSLWSHPSSKEIALLLIYTRCS